MEILPYAHCEFLSANVIQCNIFIFENERRTGFNVNISRETI